MIIRNTILSLLLCVYCASAADQVRTTLTLRGEYDSHTNTPLITIQAASGSSITLTGRTWTNFHQVNNGDIWTVRYPASDHQFNLPPVILNGRLCDIGTDGVTNKSRIWIRLPEGFSGARYAFTIDPYVPGSVNYRCIEYFESVTDTNIPLSRLSLWGGAVSGFNFWGTINTSLQTILGLSVGSDFGVMLQTNNTISAFPITTNINSGWHIIPVSAVSNVIQVACGNWHASVLLKDGTVVNWGSNQEGQTNIPSGLNGVASIACGSTHTLAVKTNGTVVAWGGNSRGETTVPSGLSNVVQVAGGSRFSVALKSNGTVSVWGDSEWGVTNVPSGLSDVVRISCGVRHISALKSDGTVVSWGNGFTSPNIQDVVYMVSGDDSDWLVKSDGTVSLVNKISVMTMPPTVTNTVLLSAKGRTVAALSGPVFLEAESKGGTNMRVTWPAAVAGRLATSTNFTNWSLVTNTVMYAGERKYVYINNALADTSRFFRLTSDSTPVTLGIGVDVLNPPIATGNTTNPPSGPPPAPGTSMMMVSEEDMQMQSEEVILDTVARATMTRQQYINWQLNRMTELLQEAMERARQVREARKQYNRP